MEALLTGRTLGTAMFGLRSNYLQGQPPLCFSDFVRASIYSQDDHLHRRHCLGGRPPREAGAVQTDVLRASTLLLAVCAMQKRSKEYTRSTAAAHMTGTVRTSGRRAVGTGIHTVSHVLEYL